MLIEVSKDIYPFLIVFFTFLAVFVMVTFVLEGGYSFENYEYMKPFPLIVNNLQTFRNSIGDLAEPDIGKWIKDKTVNYNPVDSEGFLKNNYQYAIMTVVWFFFIANIFIMQIVLLNFLIAEVSMTYENIKGLGPCLLYQKKQELNFFIQKVVKSYGLNNPFKSLIFISST